MTHQGSTITFIRPSSVILIARLISIEIIILLLFSLLKVPQIIYFQEIGSVIQYTNLASWLVLIASSFIQVFAITSAVLSWANEYYIIRSAKIIHRFGIFRTKENQYSIDNIESLSLEQSWYQRLLNYGTIRFYSPLLKKEFSLTNINNPKYVLDMLEQATMSSEQGGKEEKIVFKR